MAYITAPAFLASALVNGDCSGLSTYADKRVFVATRKALHRDRLEVIDICRDENGEPDKPRFTWQFRLYGGIEQGGSILNFEVAEERNA